MSTVDVVGKRKVRVANTHNVLSRVRPLNGTASVGEVAVMTTDGKWEKANGGKHAFGIFLGFTDGRVDGLVGDDAEVLMMGIVAGVDVDPGEIVYNGDNGTITTTGTQKIGVGLNDGLLYINPAL